MKHAEKNSNFAKKKTNKSRNHQIHIQTQIHGENIRQTKFRFVHAILNVNRRVFTYSD